MRFAHAKSIGLRRLAYGSGDSEAAFTPENLFAASEAGAWYDPSDLSTLWQDTGGTVQVTADGQNVARIDDKSGNGNHLTQGTSSLRPVYKTDGTNHWLLFDGADDMLASAALSGNLVTGGGALAVALKSDEAEQSKGVFTEQRTTSTAGFINIISDTRNTLFRHSNYAPDGTNRLISFASEQATDERSLILNNDGTTVTGYKDGSSVDTVSGTANFSGATRLELGRQESGPAYFGGRVYDAVARGTALTAQEISDLSTYHAGQMP